MNRHGGQPHAVAAWLGRPAAQFMDFSASINPDGPPASVITALREAVSDTANIFRYPDLDSAELKLALAAYAGSRPEQVAVGNGFVPLLAAALSALPVRSCIVPMPAFNEYRSTLERQGVRVIPHLLRAEDFAYRIDHLSANAADAILLANPQNPSGVLTSRATVRSLVERAADRGTTVLLDEAFIDYAPDESLVRWVEELPNLVVFRSVTKFFGIPGLRVAYAVANASLTSRIEANMPPWPACTLAQKGVIAALGDTDFARDVVPRNAKRRQAMEASLNDLGFKVYPGSANYLLVRVGEGVVVSSLWQSLAECGFLLRQCDNFEGLHQGHLRIAVRSEFENDQLMRVMVQLLGMKRA